MSLIKDIVKSLQRNGCETKATYKIKVNRDVEVLSVEVSDEAIITFEALQDLLLLNDKFWKVYINHPYPTMCVVNVKYHKRLSRCVRALDEWRYKKIPGIDDYPELKEYMI